MQANQTAWLDKSTSCLRAAPLLEQHELPCHPLATPKPLTAADAHRMAKEYFDHWFESASRYLAAGIGRTEKGWSNEAAFELR